MKFLFACFRLCAPLAALLIFGAVAALIGYVLMRGCGVLSPELIFADTPPAEAVLKGEPVRGGLWPAIMGTLALTFLSLAIVFLPAVGTGVYLAEFAPPKRKAAAGFVVEALSGAPSIVMGLFGFTLILFLRRTVFPEANDSLLLSALCIALLILPVPAVATREALEALPAETRLLAAALGFSRAAALRSVLLPMAARGITGGLILALGRAAEDTAVIMLTGVVIGAGTPSGLLDRFEALPFSVYLYANEYQNEHDLALAFGAAIVLLALSLFLIALSHALLAAHTKRFSGRRG